MLLEEGGAVSLFTHVGRAALLKHCWGEAVPAVTSLYRWKGCFLPPSLLSRLSAERTGPGTAFDLDP